MQKRNDLYGFLGPGLPYFKQNGVTLIDKLKQIIIEANKKLGYEYIQTPLLVPTGILDSTGHTKHYAEDIYHLNNGTSIKPMNCPGFLASILQEGELTEEDCNRRVAEISGLVARTEYDHVLGENLKRLYIFTQDDSHALVTSDDSAKNLIKQNLTIMNDIYKMFGFDFEDENFRVVVTRGKPEKSLGTDEDWKKSEKMMVDILEELKTENIIPEYDFIDKDAAFYGPKINFRVNCGGKWIQCGTVQLDYLMPKEMGIKYKGEDGKDHFPIMIHRAFLGSYERAVLILMEKYKEKFPMWLSPVQARILTRSNQDVIRANKLAERMYKKGIIVEIDSNDLPIEEKLKQEEQEEQFRVPYLIQLGENGNLVVSSRDTGEIYNITEKNFINRLVKQIEEKEQTTR